MFLYNRRKTNTNAEALPTSSFVAASRIPSQKTRVKQPIVLPTEDDSPEPETPSHIESPAPASSASSTPAETSSEETDVQYEVEAIWGHEFRKDELWYKVKWKEYDVCTFEPAHMLERDCPGLCKDYKAKAKLNPDRSRITISKGRKRRDPSALESESTLRHPLSSVDEKFRDAMKALGITRKVARKGYEMAYSRGWPNADTDWGTHLAKIDAVVEVRVNDSKKQLVAYLIWTAGNKTIHLVEDLHARCPLKLLAHYEENLMFS